MTSELETNQVFVRQLARKVGFTPGGDLRHEAFEAARQARILADTIESATTGRMRLTTLQLDECRAELREMMDDERSIASHGSKPTATAPAADRESVVNQRLGELIARRNLSPDELGEVERLRTEARKLEIKRRGY